MRIVRRLLAGAAILVACGEPTAPRPVPGELIVRLETPADDDAAILFSVTGPALDNIQFRDGVTAHTRPVENGFRSAVFGTLSSGTLVRFSVPDLNRRTAYSATIVEVSDQSNALVPSLSGYRLVIE